MAHDFTENTIYLTDINLRYTKELPKFSSLGNVIIKIADIEKDFNSLGRRFDTCFAINVLEHVENDVQALRNVYQILKKNGRFIFLVPAHKRLYNSIDKTLGHYRRYSRDEIKTKVAKTKFNLVGMFYFNSLALIGWFFTGTILRRPLISEGAISLFDKLIYIKQKLGISLRGKTGISIIVVLQK